MTTLMESNKLCHDKLGRPYHEHKYCNGRPNRELTLAEFTNVISKSKIEKRYKAYVVMLYWIGCRRGEPLRYIVKKDGKKTVKYEGLKKEDIKLENDSLIISNLPAFKHGERGGAIGLPLSFYGVNLIREQWESKIKPNSLLFDFCDKTGYLKVKKLFPKMSPHWFRHNRVTQLRKQIDGENVSIDDVKSFTGIKSDRTIQNYGMKTQEGVDRVVKVLR